MREKALLHGYVLCNSKMLPTLQGWSGTKNILMGDKLSMAMHSQDTNPAPGGCIWGTFHSHKWSYVVMDGGEWSCVVVQVGHSDTGLFVVICGCVQSRMVVSGHAGSSMVLHGHPWWRVVTCGHTQLGRVVFSCTWS